MGRKTLFNDNWEFTKKEIGTSMEEVLGSSTIWQRVDIPHDWVIYDTASFHESCEGWYKKYIFLVPGGKELKNISLGEHYILRFEGIYMDSTIFVNGVKTGEWKYGYSTFEVDITGALREGENEILVRAVLKVPNSRWYTGGGIYRNVWLKRVPPSHLASDGIYIAAKKEGDTWQVRIESEVSHLLEKKVCFLRHTILDEKGDIFACREGEEKVQTIEVAAPKLWDIESPILYTLKTELVKDGQTIDREFNTFGFRTIRFDCDTGFYLNDRHIKIHGVCEHHDLGALGAAVNFQAIKRRLFILKEMGVNAIRTAHNMCAIELLDLADEMGFLICNEVFDMWERPKNPYDYARFFKEWAERDIENWVKRDRNHPCLIMWSIGNEIYDTHADERGEEITKRLMELVYQYDSCHNAPVTIGSNYMPWENARKCADVVKLAGYNYGEKYYKEHHEKYKDWMMYGSETGSVVQSRGVYHFPLSADILCDDDEQCSSLGNSITSWGAKSIQKCILDDRDNEFLAGMFIWSGFDYIGEPTPYHTKNSYFGQIDTAGFKKDSFYIYQAAWTDYKTKPMVHIFPYWDFNEGQLIDIRICSNAPKVELIYNGISKGSLKLDPKTGEKLIADWRLPYEKGEICAIAYDENDNIIARDVQRSFSDPVGIIIKPDKTELQGDGRDLIFAEIFMEDEWGNKVCNANNRVQVKVEGAGRLIGLDNGDSIDYDSYKGISRRLFNGALLAIIGAKTETGSIIMEVSSKGLPAKKITFLANKCEPIEGISALMENTNSIKESARKSSLQEEIPIRKLEIISPLGRVLNKELFELRVEAKIYPENATYKDILWKVTNEKGVDSNLASLITKDRETIIRAHGDGRFYLRAMSKNGGEKIQLISLLEFEATGLGTAYLNPYEFIAGSLYSKGFGELGNGNERGVATARDGESIVVYENLDFGSFGSDEITIPIFELGSKATPIEIWEGIPYEKESRLLTKAVYHKKSIWNTYQEETYLLEKRISGITSIAFVLRDKVHIKGFQFTKQNKAYAALPVTAYNHIYGDDYTLKEDGVYGIGNNVTITFEDMDFGESKITGLIICGHSCCDKNTIHVKFDNGHNEITQLVEFLYSKEDRICEFELEQIKGMQKVSFLFLPGSNFDFKWFRFE